MPFISLYYQQQSQFIFIYDLSLFVHCCVKPGPEAVIAF